MASTTLVYWLYSTLFLAVAGANPVALEHGVQIRNAPGASTADTTKAIRQALTQAEIERRDDESFSRWADLERNWDGEVLFQLDGTKSTNAGGGNVSASASVEVVCTRCYLKGNASVELVIDDDFNITTYNTELEGSVTAEVENVTEQVKAIFKNFVTQLDDPRDWPDAPWPSFDNVSLDLDIPPAPGVNLKFRFDDLDLYLEFDSFLSLGATYEIPLYQPFGLPIQLPVGGILDLNVNFGVSLILSFEGEIDVSSGVHLALDDGVGLNVALFGDEVSDVTFNGGQFEFLPVKLVSANMVFTAILRVGAHASLNLTTDDNVFIDMTEELGERLDLPTFQGGMEVGVYADVAKFVTNVTATPQNETCKLHAVQEYTLALGATAAATFQIGDAVYGPTAAPHIDIWYTTMASACAIEGSPTRTSSTVSAVPTISRRQALETTTLETEVLSTVIGCATPTSGSCPASLQTTLVHTATVALTTAVPSGETASWALVATTTASPISFGSNAQSIGTITGSPSPYTPPPSPTSTSSISSSVNGILNGEVRGVSNKVIIGLCVGLGLPLLVGIVIIVLFYQRRRRYTAVPVAAKSEPVSRPLNYE